MGNKMSESTKVMSRALVELEDAYRAILPCITSQVLVEPIIRDMREEAKNIMTKDDIAFPEETDKVQSEFVMHELHRLHLMLIYGCNIEPYDPNMPEIQILTGIANKIGVDLNGEDLEIEIIVECAKLYVKKQHTKMGIIKIVKYR